MWLSQSTCLTTPILPPLPQSVPPRPSSVRPPPPPLLHPFLAALHPSTGQTFFLAVSHLSFTFYLSVPLFPRLPSFITTLFLSSPILPRITELLYGLSQIHCRLLLCLVWFFALPPWQIHVNKQAVLHQQQNHSLICHIFTISTLQLS